MILWHLWDPKAGSQSCHLTRLESVGYKRGQKVKFEKSKLADGTLDVLRATWPKPLLAHMRALYHARDGHKCNVYSNLAKWDCIHSIVNYSIVSYCSDWIIHDKCIVINDLANCCKLLILKDLAAGRGWCILSCNTHHTRNS